jgi:hypothetical protein
VALVLGLAGVFALSQKPFQDTRPKSIVLPLENGQLNDGQDVEARLWEDPLSAVALARNAKEPPPAYEPSGLQDTLWEHEHNNRTLILGVMVNGAPYTDDIETRRRARYAVLAGLYRSGFVPSNPNHIGYLLTERSVEVYPYGQGPQHVGPGHDIAAFEWFHRDNTATRPGTKSPDVASHAIRTSQPAQPSSTAIDEASSADRVLLLWLDQEGFRSLPVRKLSEILGTIVGRDKARVSDPRVTVAILGPADSDGLREMYDETQSPAAQGVVSSSDLLPMSFYNSRATASDPSVLNAEPSSTRKLADELTKSARQIHFIRTVTDDQRVADEVIHELSARGIERNEIALVAERDTLYARGMGRYFGGCNNPPRLDPSQQPDLSSKSDHVRCFTYLRGLDGLVPTGTTAPATPTTPAPKSADSSSASAGSTDTSDEAIGPSQLDYLRRLADGIAAIRQAKDIKAIGVISSDVYDKLLVLQALRGALPNVTYFTFDLDARLLEQRNLKWTRQLLVGSSLGLSLRPRLQGDIPPFRDTYQSSTFFATLLAIHRFVKSSDPDDDTQSRLQWIDQPRIFEIGRNQAYDLIGEPVAEHCDFDADCPYIAAVRHSWLWNRPASRLRGLWMGLILSLLCVGAWTVAIGRRGIVGTSRAHKFPLFGTRRWSNGKGSLILATTVLIVTIIAWPWLVDVITQSGHRVPTPLFGGANQWTPSIVDVAAILAVVVLLVRGQRKLHDNAESLRREFGFHKTRDELIRWHRAQIMPRRLRQRGLALFWFPMRALPRQSGSALAAGDVSPLEATIAQYLDHGTAPARFLRVACVTLVSGLLLAAVERMLGIIMLRVSMQWISLASLFATQFLILWTADALFLSRSFLLALWRDQPAWPEDALRKECERSGLPKDRATLWLDLRLIARRTSGVANLVWYPSIVIATLTVVALTIQFREFQFANNPVALLVGAVFVIASALGLRRAAEAWREGVIHRLEDDRLREHTRADDRAAAQLDRLLQRVRALHEGAFAPYSEQPIVRAVLVPALTYGATVGLQYAHLGP